MSDPISEQIQHQAGYEGDPGRAEEAKALPGYAEAKLLADSIPRGEMRAFAAGDTAVLLFRSIEGRLYGTSLAPLDQFGL